MNAGAMRLHAFATFECRVLLTKRCGAQSGAEAFAREATLWSLPGCASFRVVPDVGHLIPATQTRGAIATVMIEVTETVGFRFPSGFERPMASTPKSEPDAPTEPELESQAELEQVEPVPPSGFTWGFATTAPRTLQLSMKEDGEEVKGQAERGESQAALMQEAEEKFEDVAAPGSEQLSHYLFTMQQERRPPLMGCWLVKSIVPVREHQRVRVATRHDSRLNALLLCPCPPSPRRPGRLTAATCPTI